MWTAALAELLALERKLSRKLDEVYGITQELAEAVEREDQVSVKMLISGRQQPLLELQELHATVGLKRCDLSGEDEASFDRLVLRREPPETEEETAVANQVASNRRVLERLVALDRRINSRICGDKSIYRGR